MKARTAQTLIAGIGTVAWLLGLIAFVIVMTG